jgi:hypothetical protein
VRDRLEELADDDAPPTDEEWERMRRVADALAAVEPSADRFENRETATVEVTTDRFQVSVYRHEAAVNIPYWDEAEDVMGRVAPYLAILERDAGFRFFDPQTEEEVSAATLGGKGYAASYEKVRPVLDQISGEQPRAPRWKFWKR